MEAHARELIADGHEVHVISAANGFENGIPGTSEWPSIARLHVTRIPIPVLDGGRRLFFADGAPEALEKPSVEILLQCLGFWAGTCEHLRAHLDDFDAIHAHWLTPSALIACAVAPARIPIFAHAHSGDIALMERLPLGRSLACWLSSRVAEIRFVSANLEKRFRALVGGPIGARCRVEPALRIIAPSAPQKTHEPNEAIAPRKNDDRSGVVVLAVGRLVPIKGFDVLLKAVSAAVSTARARQLSPHRVVSVVILGDGPERHHLIDLAARLGIRLTLPGFVPPSDVATWMRRSDVYVQPSRVLPNGRTEGLPVAASEALNAGLPVLVSDSGGLPELARLSERVRTFPAGNDHALAKLLEGYVSDEARMFVSNA